MALGSDRQRIGKQPDRHVVVAVTKAVAALFGLAGGKGWGVIDRRANTRRTRGTSTPFHSLAGSRCPRRRSAGFMDCSRPAAKNSPRKPLLIKPQRSQRYAEEFWIVKISESSSAYLRVLRGFLISAHREPYAARHCWLVKQYRAPTFRARLKIS